MASLQSPPKPKISTYGQSSIPHLLLALLIITYTAYFSWYTINRHNTLNSYAADLSLIDQPMWNTVRGPGGFMELTWGDRQQPRLAEHFEPILFPLALLFFLWDDVRILLIAQSLALALGALPVFWIARHQFSLLNGQVPDLRQFTTFGNSQPSAIHNWAALVFAITYLLFPHLQAANIADFHADPFVVTPLLFAFWYATQKRWRWMWLWAVVAMLTKENLPLLTAMLGVWLLMRAYLQSGKKIPGADLLRPQGMPAAVARMKRLVIGRAWPALRQSGVPNGATGASTPEAKHGLALIFISVVWFLVATFLIVAPLARQYFGSDGPIYLANRFSGGLAALPALLQDPARWQYLFGLFAPVGFLPLLAPELLILGLPVLVANLLSNFPGQYSGEQHYSAPLVATFILAAIYGTRRLLDNVSLRERNGQSIKITALIATSLWLLYWSLGYHTLYGWTPLSIRTETYRLSPAAVQLSDFTTQIPSQAVVSASAGLHPHLAHRRVHYVFPTVQEADYLMVDVTDIPGVHPNDARTQIMDILNTNWQILKANHGLLLASTTSQPANSPTPQLPNAFFDFARTTTSPSYPVRLTFGDGRLRFLGYDILDDPDDGVTFRLYWQTSNTLPEDLKLWPLVYDDLGQLLSNPVQVPMVTTVWYPPAAWQPGEIIITETLPQLLPDSFHLGLAVGSTTNSFNNPTQRWPITNSSDENIHLHSGQWAQLATFKRQGPFLTHLPSTPSLQPLTPIQAQFGPAIQLTGFWLDTRTLSPGSSLPLLLQWEAIQPPQLDFTVFVHLLAPDGRLVTQSDAFPTWLTPQPTSQWPPHQLILDSHSLSLPSDLSPATYTLQLGLYRPQTLERLPLPDGSTTFQLTQIHVK